LNHQYTHPLDWGGVALPLTALIVVIVIVVLLGGGRLRTWWNMNRLRNDLERRRRLRLEGREASDPPDNEP
jgi:hypothetical protein